MKERLILRAVILAAVGVTCGPPSQPAQPTDEITTALTSCASHGVQVVDMQSDFRDIWAGRETTVTGKQADPSVRVTLDFNATVQPSLVAGQFVPVKTDGSCGGTVATKAGVSVIAGDTWGKTSSDSARPSVPAPYNVFARETLSGVVSAAGPLAAGGDISLSSFSVNSTAGQPVGLIAGGKVTVANGSIAGNVTYGVASTIPQSVSVSGTKSLQSFTVDTAFQNLEALSALLASEPATGTAVSTNGTLQLTGTKSGLNVFQLSGDTLAQASTVNITVPSGAGALVNVTGTSVAIQNKGINVTGVAPSGLLWNLPAASFLTISSVGLIGSVLAPDARLSFQSGSINGTIVVRTFSSPGSGSLQYAPLNVGLLLGSASPSATQLVAATPLIRGCTYQFVIPSTQVLTSGGSCLSAALNVSFGVAAHPSTAAGRELDDARSDANTKTLRALTARSGINTPVGDIWTRYQSGFGITPSELVPSGATRPSATVPGQTLTVYQQYHQGYPVFDYGYIVASSNGIFRSADGKTMPGLQTFSSTPIAASSAVQSALAFLKITTPPWITDPAKNHPPMTTLGLMARNPNPAPSDFSLVWDVQFPQTGVRGSAAIQVDAATGQVVGVDPARVHLTFLDPNATYSNQDPSGTVETPNDGRQSINVAVYRQPTGPVVTTLTTGNITTPDGLLSVVFQPPPGPVSQVSGRFVVNPSLNWTAATGATEQAMATIYLGLSRANVFMQSLQLLPAGTTPWTSIDGRGHQRVIMGWEDQIPGSISAYDASLSDADIAYIAMVSPLDRTTPPHEYAHALLANIRRAVSLPTEFANRGESGSLDEGIADLFAISSIHSFTPTATDWQCILNNNSCAGIGDARDLSNPARTQFPNYYGGQFYKTYPDINNCTDTDLCFRHTNATVIGYWGYLLGLGSLASPEKNLCNLTIEPLDSDPDTALKRLLTIVYLAASDMSFGALSTPTFADFREATIRAAQQLATIGVYPADTPKKVELAWYAVGLGPQSQGASTSVVTPPDQVSPPDGSRSVNPWQTFMWPADGDGQKSSAWDFQIADGPFDTNLKLEVDGITSTTDRNGTTMAVFRRSLPFESPSRFFWRVRPATTGAWSGCYPVHSFQGTGSPGPIQNFHLVRTLAPDGKVQAGEALFGWNDVDGAVEYLGYAATHEPNCTPSAGVTQVQDLSGPNAFFGGFVNGPPGLEPSSHYWIDAQAVGPPDFANTPSVGGCFSAQVDTSGLGTPVQIAPDDGALFDDRGPGYPNIVWSVSQETLSSRVRFFELDENGDCPIAPGVSDPNTPPVLTETVSTPCGASCGGQINPLIFPKPNPTGYCWDVTGIADNGVESAPSQLRTFRYVHAHVQQLSPGVQGGISELDRVPAPLPGDSYGTDVTLSWTSDPDAAQYVVRAWRWEPQPFPFTVVDPPNCDGGTSTSSCETPLHVLYQNTVAGSSVTVGGAIGSQGRSCWTLWPLIAAPNAPGVVSSRQPIVRPFPNYCYTSGPAKPRFVVDNPPVATGFSSKPITGRVEFDYAPDGQWQISTNSPDIHLGPSCPVAANAFIYADVYNCKVSFTITPHEDQTYDLVARTYNSDVSPPIMNDTTKVHEIPQELKTGHCGGSGQLCCDGNTCDTAGLVCKNGSCTACGANGQACCSGNVCNGMPTFPGATSGFYCKAGTCAPCGALGQDCCTGNHCIVSQIISAGKGTGVSCQAGTCSQCGNVNQVCCPELSDSQLPGGFPACPGTEIIKSNGSTSLSACANNHCSACGHNGEPCCIGNVCGDNLACNQGHCSPTNGGGGNTSCPPGTASCGNSACIDPFATPGGPGWDLWRMTNPTSPAVMCQSNGLWDCVLSLNSFPTPPGVVSQIAGGTAVCCPPTAVAVVGDLCIEDINGVSTSDPQIDQP